MIIWIVFNKRKNQNDDRLFIADVGRIIYVFAWRAEGRRKIHAAHAAR